MKSNEMFSKVVFINIRKHRALSLRLAVNSTRTGTTLTSRIAFNCPFDIENKGQSLVQQCYVKFLIAVRYCIRRGGPRMGQKDLIAAWFPDL